MPIRIALAAICLLTAVTSFGQTFYGSVVGAVTDATGSAVPQANVTLINLGTADRRSAQTDDGGTYQFVNLVPGQYRVEIKKVDFVGLSVNRYRRSAEHRTD